MGMLIRRRNWEFPVPTQMKEKPKEVSTNDGKRKTRKARSADLPSDSKLR